MVEIHVALHRSRQRPEMNEKVRKPGFFGQVRPPPLATTPFRRSSPVWGSCKALTPICFRRGLRIVLVETATSATVVGKRKGVPTFGQNLQLEPRPRAPIGLNDWEMQARNGILAFCLVYGAEHWDQPYRRPSKDTPISSIRLNSIVRYLTSTAN